MKATTTLYAAIIAVFFSCNLSVKVVPPTPKNVVIKNIRYLLNASVRTGFFATSFIDTVQGDSMLYVTELAPPDDTVAMYCDGTETFVAYRYDLKTYDIVWVVGGGGSGNDKGCNYWMQPDSDYVLVLGYFERTAYFSCNNGTGAFKTVTSRGGTDMFLAKYHYNSPVLEWVVSGGGAINDVTLNDMTRHDQNGDPLSYEPTHIDVDSAGNINVYAVFFGNPRFGSLSCPCNPSGLSVIKIVYDQSGVAKSTELNPPEPKDP